MLQHQYWFKFLLCFSDCLGTGFCVNPDGHSHWAIRSDMSSSVPPDIQIKDRAGDRLHMVHIVVVCYPGSHLCDGYPGHHCSAPHSTAQELQSGGLSAVSIHISNDSYLPLFCFAILPHGIRVCQNCDLPVEKYKEGTCSYRYYLIDKNDRYWNIKRIFY